MSFVTTFQDNNDICHEKRSLLNLSNRLTQDFFYILMLFIIFIFSRLLYDKAFPFIQGILHYLSRSAPQ